MRKNSKKLVLPAIAAAGAAMGAMQASSPTANADFVVSLSSPSITGSAYPAGYQAYTIVAVNNGQNGSGTGISGADITITMTAPSTYLKFNAQGYTVTPHKGPKDVDLTGTNSSYSTVPWGTYGTMVDISGASLTADFENGVKDTTSIWNSQANPGTTPANIFSTISTVEIVVASTNSPSVDNTPIGIGEILVPVGDKFTVTGAVGTTLSGGNKFQTNFTTGNGGSAPIGPIVLLSATAPTNTGSQVSGTYTPATSPTLTVTKTNPGDYLPGYIHSITGGINSGYTAVTGFSGGDTEIFLVKLSSSAEDAVLVADINASGNSTVTASLPAAGLANFGGTAWDLELTSTNSAPLGAGYFGFNFSGDTNIGGITVTDVAAVPEPATVGLLLVGGLGLLARRRRSAN